MDRGGGDRLRPAPSPDLEEEPVETPTPDRDMLTRLNELDHTPFAGDTTADTDRVVDELLARDETVPVARFGSAI